MIGYVRMLSILFGALTFVSTLTGGVVAIRYRKQFGVLAAFAASVLIAVSLFDLLPETLKLAAKVGRDPEEVM